MRLESAKHLEDVRKIADDQVVWNVVEQDLSKLHAQVLALLPEDEE